MLNDKKIVLESVRTCGSILECVSDSLKNDKEVVLEAVKENECSFIYASDELKKDRNFVLEIVKMFVDEALFTSKNL